MKQPLKILSWNINGLRSQKGNFKSLLDSLNSDIVCLQETKVTRDQLEEELAIVDGYYSFFNFSRKKVGYSGVATYCKKNVGVSYAQEGLSGTLAVGSLMDDCGAVEALPLAWDQKELKDLDAEGRCIITQHAFQDENGEKKVLSLVNVYCPRADPERPERADFKLSFYKLLRQRVTTLRNSGSHVLIVGDINTSHRKIDHCDPCDDEEDFSQRPDRLFLDQFLVNGASVSQNEYAAKKKLDDEVDEEEDQLTYEGIRVVDTFRRFHPDRQNAFTCWNTSVNARMNNYGTRIDYILSDEDFLSNLEDADIHPDVLGSDHCPVSVKIGGLRPLSSVVVPSICTKFYPEFHGNQQKLSAYFGTRVNGSTTGLSIRSDSLQSNQRQSPKRKQDRNETLPSQNAKRKSNDSKQSTLSSFFIKVSDKKSSNSDIKSPCSRADDNSRLPSLLSDSQSTENLQEAEVHRSSTNISSEIPEKESKTHCSSSEVKPAKNNPNWGFLMKGPPPAPLCSGHKEPSVLRTVKKKGPNLNKQFYACARGLGKEGDPNANCNFFQWVKKPR